VSKYLEEVIMRQPLQYAIKPKENAEEGGKRDKHKQTGDKRPVQKSIRMRHILTSRPGIPWESQGLFPSDHFYFYDGA
ncbi:MAG: hypothetical protein II008_14155, partial [Oscillospiraceae bacterium]|nr:hypothetical protein [Oscillospiraceae bacterium]